MAVGKNAEQIVPNVWFLLHRIEVPLLASFVSLCNLRPALRRCLPNVIKLWFFLIKMGFGPPKLQRDARFYKIIFRAVFRCYENDCFFFKSGWASPFQNSSETLAFIVAFLPMNIDNAILYCILQCKSHVWCCRLCYF